MENRVDDITKELVYQSIDEFKNIDWSKIPQNEIFDALPVALRSSICIPAVPFKHGTNIFRARSFDSISSNDNICKKKSFQYPPASCTDIYRCNFRGDPIFYGSSCPHTACIETAALENLFFLSRWTLKDTESEIKLYPFIENVDNRFPIRYIDDYFNSLVEFMGRERALTYRLLYSFQNEEFVKNIADYEKYLYKYTAFLTMNILKIPFPEVYDGLMFQSIKRQRGVGNYAIKTEIVDSKFDLCEVYLLGVPTDVSYSTNDYVIEPIIAKMGRYNKLSDTIKWETPVKEDFHRFSSYFEAI